MAKNVISIQVCILVAKLVRFVNGAINPTKTSNLTGLKPLQTNPQVTSSHDAATAAAVAAAGTQKRITSKRSRRHCLRLPPTLGRTASAHPGGIRFATWQRIRK